MERKISVPCDYCAKWALTDDDVCEDNICHRCERLYCWRCSDIVFKGIEKTLCDENDNIIDYYTYYHTCLCCEGKLKCRVTIVTYDYDKGYYDKRCSERDS